MSQHRESMTIHVDHLVPGLFVVDLDIAWIDSPFLKHQRKVKDKKEIDALRSAGVQIITIDKSRCEPMALKLYENSLRLSRSQEAPAQHGSSSNESIPQNTLPEGDKPSDESALALLHAEMPKAQALRLQIVKVAENTLKLVEKSDALKLQAITPLIDDTLKSLQRNSQALLSLAHMSRKTQKLADHSFSVFCLALNLAESIGTPRDSCRALGVAALLHDSAWVNLPISLMGKRQKYSASEQKLIDQHCQVTDDLLADSADRELVLRLIQEHHERLDGSGRPHGYSAEALHPLSKILMVADYYDELIHQLMDRPGMLPTHALKHIYLESEAGRYSAKVCQQLISSLGIYPVSSAVALSNGEKGVVISVDVKSHQPLVKVIYDKAGKVLKPAIDRQLGVGENESVTIKSVLDSRDTTMDPNGLLRLDVQ